VVRALIGVKEMSSQSESILFGDSKRQVRGVKGRKVGLIKPLFAIALLLERESK